MIKNSFLLFGLLVTAQPIMSHSRFEYYEETCKNLHCQLEKDTLFGVGLIAGGIVGFCAASLLFRNIIQKQDQARRNLQGNPTNTPGKRAFIHNVQWFGPLPDEAQQIFDFVKDKKLFEQAGIDGTSNILLKGIPGTGKSHLARYIAQELKVPFFEASSGDFHNKYIGVGPQALRELFKNARNTAHSRRSNVNKNTIGAIVFIDEIEGIAKSRDAIGNGESSGEETRLINTLLAELTNPENKDILVICATNCPDMLDNALKRTGRFGLHVTMQPPAFENRKALFEAFLISAYNKSKKKNPHPYSQKLYERAAAKSAGFVPSDIQEAVKRALTKAVRNRKATTATEQELLDEIETIMYQKQTENKSYLQG